MTPFPTIDVELWIAKRVGLDQQTLFAGRTTPEIRRERIRTAIVERDLAAQVAGKRASNGQPESFGALFQRLYAQPLIPPQPTAAHETRSTENA